MRAVRKAGGGGKGSSMVVMAGGGPSYGSEAQADYSQRSMRERDAKRVNGNLGRSLYIGETSLLMILLRDDDGQLPLGMKGKGKVLGTLGE